MLSAISNRNFDVLAEPPMRPARLSSWLNTPQSVSPLCTLGHESSGMMCNSVNPNRNHGIDAIISVLIFFRIPLCDNDFFGEGPMEPIAQILLRYQDVMPFSSANQIKSLWTAF
jgi:hypothetical protein